MSQQIEILKPESNQKAVGAVGCRSMGVNKSVMAYAPGKTDNPHPCPADQIVQGNTRIYEADLEIGRNTSLIGGPTKPDQASPKKDQRYEIY